METVPQDQKNIKKDVQLEMDFTGANLEKEKKEIKKKFYITDDLDESLIKKGNTWFVTYDRKEMTVGDYVDTLRSEDKEDNNFYKKR